MSSEKRLSLSIAKKFLITNSLQLKQNMNAEAIIKEVADKKILQQQMAGVSYRAESKSRRFGIPSNTSVWSANEGLRRADGTRGGFPFERGRRSGRSGKTFHHLGISARSPGKTCRLGFDGTSHSELLV